jgi:hypothetical protein
LPLGGLPRAADTGDGSSSPSSSSGYRGRFVTLAGRDDILRFKDFFLKKFKKKSVKSSLSRS